MIKNIFISVLLLLSIASVYGQVQPLSTQFMFNKLALNPAYAGAEAQTELTAIVRSQWIGFPGAPKTQQLSANIPLFDQRVGLGLTANSHSLGVTTFQTIEGSYSYRIKTGDTGTLSLGLQTSYRRYTIDFSDPQIVALDGIANDPNILGGNVNTSSLNFGGGIYYSQDNFYLGISIPRLSAQDLTLGDGPLNLTEQRVVNLMGGFKIDLNEQWTVTPQLLFRFTGDQPFDADGNVSFTYNDFLSLGLSYRHGGDRNSLGESIDFIIGVELNETLMLGAAYDYNVSELGRVSSGSFEGLVRYRIGAGQGNIIDINPRYF